MAFKILPIAKVYGYAGQYADNQDIKVYLGLRPNQKLPHDMQKQVTVTLLDGRETALYVVPSTPAPEGPRRWRNKSSAHRTFALCPDCLKAVPAGRTHQHKCKDLVTPDSSWQPADDLIDATECMNTDEYIAHLEDEA